VARNWLGLTLRVTQAPLATNRGPRPHLPTMLLATMLPATMLPAAPTLHVLPPALGTPPSCLNTPAHPTHLPLPLLGLQMKPARPRHTSPRTC